MKSEIDQITKIHNKAFNNPDEGKIVEDLRKNKNLTV
jgi:predicted N-acetyltransferase YhbS